MLVAWWVYRQTVPVSVRDVSEAFHISARRAGDLLLYLMNSVSHVQCTRVWQAIPGGGRRRVWSVLAHRRPAAPQTGPGPRPGAEIPAGPPPGAVTGIRDLRAWMVSRRPGEPVPVEDTGTLSDGRGHDAYFHHHPEHLGDAGSPGALQEDGTEVRVYSVESAGELLCAAGPRLPPDSVLLPVFPDNHPWTVCVHSRFSASGCVCATACWSPVPPASCGDTLRLSAVCRRLPVSPLFPGGCPRGGCGA
ncbi:Protein of uncharacterised function (DUF1401) [Salmonella enterica]|nr:Protein of uncharacterised function (DUF1401) [Salmonella enterica]